MKTMHDLRRKEKEITDSAEIRAILTGTKYITIAMCHNNEPYLVTLSHGYDQQKNVLYFHCAPEGKKIVVLTTNDRVWGQAIMDYGYAGGKCDHLFASVHFRGRVSFVKDEAEKRWALETMIHQLESTPDIVMADQITAASIAKVQIGRIDLDYLSGKKSDKVIVTL